jgi:hypothetical protein
MPDGHKYGEGPIMVQSFECLLAELCAPTLARLKPGSLFRYRPQPWENIHDELQRWNEALCARGVAIRLMKECEQTGAVLVYVYRPTWLAQILREEPTRRFLRAEGYPMGSDESILRHLAAKLCCEGEFPHEIGVFLGYPLADVEGFILNRGKNYTYCGYWKAYGDPTEAQRCFAQYKKCEQVYKRLHDAGRTVQQLTVAAL